MTLRCWQARTMLLIGTVGPPVASLILLATDYLPYCPRGTEPVDLPSFVAAFVLFAVPVGYAFGLAPALLAGAMYCGALTAVTTLRTRILLRVSVGALSGGLAGGAWFNATIGPGSHGYGSIAAVVAALLSLRCPVQRLADIDTRIKEMSGPCRPRLISLAHQTGVGSRTGLQSLARHDYPRHTTLRGPDPETVRGS